MEHLQELDVGSQIGFLFAMLFGVLLLTSAVFALKTLRDRSEDQMQTDRQFQRDLRAVWVGACVFWLAWRLGGGVAIAMFAGLSFFALREYLTLMHTRRADHRSLLMAFFVVLPVQFALLAWQMLDLFTVFVPVYAFLAMPVVSALANDPVRFLERAAKIQWGMMVCVYGLSHAPALLLLELPQHAERGAFLVFYLVVVVAAGQIVQEAASRWLRRRPVARAISRSFSWLALSWGLAAGALVGGALYWATPFAPWLAVVLGVVVSASGAFGELVMKALKRDAGVRNWSAKASVTGAVGLLDRIAPMCFAAPIFFHSVRWYFQA